MQVTKIVFSPTGGTQEVTDILGDTIAKELGVAALEQIDLADPFLDESDIVMPADAIAIIAMPCFGGRAPEIAMKRLGLIKGSGAKCIVVNVYGNRAFDDALLEMKDGANASGFKVIAAVTAIAEHSIMHQYATGRPDATDASALQEFASRIVERVASGSDMDSLHVSGNTPYVKAGDVPLVPKVTGKCVSCGKCAESCPTTAINSNDFAADKKACMACMRCIDICPQNARSVSKLMVKAAGMAIKKAASVRKECELYL
jgi:ferredoxin